MKTLSVPVLLSGKKSCCKESLYGDSNVKKKKIGPIKSFGGPVKLGFSMWLPVLRSGKGPKVFPMSVEIIHYSDIIVSVMASQITGVSTVCSGADQGKHQSSESLAFVSGIHRLLANSPQKEPVMLKMFSFDEIIMHWQYWKLLNQWWPTKGSTWYTGIILCMCPANEPQCYIVTPITQPISHDVTL